MGRNVVRLMCTATQMNGAGGGGTLVRAFGLIVVAPLLLQACGESTPQEANFAPLVQQFGSREAAKERVIRSLGEGLPGEGQFEVVRTVGGQPVVRRRRGRRPTDRIGVYPMSNRASGAPLGQTHLALLSAENAAWLRTRLPQIDEHFKSGRWNESRDELHRLQILRRSEMFGDPLPGEDQ